MVAVVDTPVLFLAAINAQWAADAAEAPRVTVVPGQTPTADWCAGTGCWTVYLRLDGYFPASSALAQDAAPQGFAPPMAARWHVGTFMCIAGMDEQGNPPPAEDQTDDALRIVDTMERLRCAIDTVIGEHFTRKTALLGLWTPTGPAGDCAGGYWPVTVRQS